MDYIISASELYQRAKEMLNRGMDYVSISLMDPDDSVPDDPLPACVHFEACSKKDTNSWFDFNEIDAIQIQK